MEQISEGYQTTMNRKSANRKGQCVFQRHHLRYAKSAKSLYCAVHRPKRHQLGDLRSEHTRLRSEEG